MPVSFGRLIPVLSLALFLSLPAAISRAADEMPPTNTNALINTAMDKQINLDLNCVLPEAMAQITQKTGVPLRAENAVWDLLPWGQDTKITAKVENQTLREALGAITQKLGLRFEVKDEYVQLEPMPALRRLARRATVQELDALDKLASTPLNPSNARPTVTQLLAMVDAKLQEIKAPYAVENRLHEDVVHMDQVVPIARNATLMDALNALPKVTDATWYAWGKTIVVIDKQDEIRRQLSKTINVRYPGVQIAQVLVDLQHLSGVRFDIEPGALQQVPPESRNIRLVLENVALRDALDNISGVTGLGWMVRDDGVYIWSQNHPEAPRQPMIGWIQLDNGLCLLVPESKVPPDMREYLQLKMQRKLDDVRQMMKEENFKPTPQSSQPLNSATQPASAPGEDL